MRRILLIGLVAALAARVTVFSAGGTVGAWASVLVFWLCVAGYVLVSLREDVLRRPAGAREPLVRFSLLVVGILSLFIGDAFPDDTPAHAVTRLVFLGAVCALVALWMARRFGYRHS